MHQYRAPKRIVLACILALRQRLAYHDGLFSKHATGLLSSSCGSESDAGVKTWYGQKFFKMQRNMIYMLESKEKCCLFCVARTDTQSSIQVQRERAGSSWEAFYTLDHQKLCFSNICDRKRRRVKQTFLLFFGLAVTLGCLSCTGLWGGEHTRGASTSGVFISTWDSAGSANSGFSSTCCFSGIEASAAVKSTSVGVCLASSGDSVPSQLGAGLDGCTCTYDSVQALWLRWRGWCSLA